MEVVSIPDGSRAHHDVWLPSDLVLMLDCLHRPRLLLLAETQNLIVGEGRGDPEIHNQTGKRYCNPNIYIVFLSNFSYDAVFI